MEKLKAKLNKQGGFTLVEMLIVVAIIAILIAISIPAMRESLERARKATDTANERAAMGVAITKMASSTSAELLALNGKTLYYKVSNTMGTLEDVTTAPSAGDPGYDYGQSKDHVGQYVKVKYTIAAGGNSIALSWSAGDNLIYGDSLDV